MLELDLRLLDLFVGIGVTDVAFIIDDLLLLLLFPLELLVEGYLFFVQNIFHHEDEFAVVGLLIIRVGIGLSEQGLEGSAVAHPRRRRLLLEVSDNVGGWSLISDAVEPCVKEK